MIADHFLFYVALAFMMTHELDAVRCNEHRILPITSWLPDKVGYVVFTALHVPLCAWLFWGLTRPLPPMALIRNLDYFFIIHVGLHLLFLPHKLNEFKSVFSWTLIVGAGFFSLIDLLLA